MNPSRSPSRTSSTLPALHAGAQVLHHPVGLQHVAADLRPEVDVLLLGLHGVEHRLPLALLVVVEAGAQDLPGHAAVLLLAALVLHRHHDAGGEVGEAHRRVGLVHLLAAGPRGAVGVDADVGLLDVDDDVVVDLRGDVHGGEAGLAPGVLVERADAHQPVDSPLGLEEAVGALAADDEGAPTRCRPPRRPPCRRARPPSPCARRSGRTSGRAWRPSPWPRRRRRRSSPRRWRWRGRAARRACAGTRARPRAAPPRRRGRRPRRGSPRRRPPRPARRARARPRAPAKARSNSETAPSSCAFSFSSPWAFWFSPQKPGSSERREISATRERFRSTSKRPPERLQACGDLVEAGGGRGRHGGRFSWRWLRAGRRRIAAPSTSTDAMAQPQAKISPNRV